MGNQDNVFLTGQDIIKNPRGCDIAGFNSKIQGYPYADTFRHQHNYDMHGGWNLAEELISKGEIYYVHNFHNLECKHGHAFKYGGYWVCNSCGNQGVDREWWKIKVMPDGNAWCCIGLGFVDLMASENYEFGDTREEAIQNYGLKMLKALDSSAGDQDG